jgi:ribosomal protein S18 acetylase RimI-like enzyme
MDRTVTIALEENPARQDIETLNNAIIEFNRARTGEDNFKPLVLFLRDEQKAIVGGVIASTSWNWLYIDVLWVREDLREQRYGNSLLSTAEQEAIRRGCDRAFLYTFSFQAPSFYQKNGYEVFGELPRFPGKHSCLFMTKQLQIT